LGKKSFKTNVSERFLSFLPRLVLGGIEYREKDKDLLPQEYTPSPFAFYPETFFFWLFEDVSARF
jgi:hypothetical protein